MPYMMRVVMRQQYRVDQIQVSDYVAGAKAGVDVSNLWRVHSRSASPVQIA
jgi:hypothetical protein